LLLISPLRIKNANDLTLGISIGEKFSTNSPQQLRRRSTKSPLMPSKAREKLVGSGTVAKVSVRVG
jgi:hypothetical protein